MSSSSSSSSAAEPLRLQKLRLAFGRALQAWREALPEGTLQELFPTLHEHRAAQLAEVFEAMWSNVAAFSQARGAAVQPLGLFPRATRRPQSRSRRRMGTRINSECTTLHALHYCHDRPSWTRSSRSTIWGSG
jgi:hypothetical protein